jgi:acyl transferase domain-containing protein/NADPH:quinone reductase-like Zn-dependent oxidoreductase/SAM-dependent methyltransferase/acyl carrier protein
MNSDLIAIIGMSGRFPGADDLAEFWRNVSGGVESVTRFTRAELLARGVAAAVLDDPNYVRLNAVLDGVELFDAEFFGFTPREAEITDPQHRIFLECAWNALEDSGYDPGNFPDQIGVYAGAGFSTYLVDCVLRRPDVVESVGSMALHIGNNKDYVPLRVSYKLNLRGPSINVNTACSSSLVAVHIACQSLLDHQCDIALAGGVGIQVPQAQGYQYTQNGVLSADGHCRAFDARADGTVGGNGAGVVVLKRYKEAVADGDTIRAVILGSAINNDGASKVGFTAPSVEGQARVISEALAVADVDPATIGYVEAHGTGTRLGDPIEVEALSQCFPPAAPGAQRCALGSVKTNIGHLDEAAGVAGLIKTILALQHGAIPPSLNFEEPNPEIKFEKTRFYVPTKLAPWDQRDEPRRAGVSSFGIGGTNAHVVLEEAARAAPQPSSRPWHLLLLSARTEGALDAMTVRLARHLRGTSDVSLADVAHTLQVGRKTFPFRRAALVRDGEDAARSLELRPQDRVRTSVAAGSRPVWFLFPGQGSQHAAMGRDLCRSEPVFRQTIDRCADVLNDETGVDLRALLCDADAQTASRLEQTEIAQPALFAVEYALAQLLTSWGIRPQAMIGHSIGEYVAACMAGVFSLEDALSLVATRGKLMQAMPRGAMLAVELGEHALMPLLGDELTLAAINAPSVCVAAGATPAIQALQDKLAARDIACRRLRTSHAFHSAFMEPMLAPFLQRVRQVALHAPAIPYLSNVTGTWITAKDATSPEYWVRHLRRTVRFADGVRELLKVEGGAFLEVGPGQSLLSLLRRHPDFGAGHLAVGAMRHPHDQGDAAACLLNAVGELWSAGACRIPEGLYAQEPRRRVPLPTYPFERKRFWIDPPDARDEQVIAPAAADRTVEDWFYVPFWKRRATSPARPGQDADRAGWLVFVDSCGLASRVVERLRRDGRHVVTVETGEAFAAKGEGAYAIDPHQPGDYDALLTALARAGDLPRRLVHLWNVSEPVQGRDDAERAQHLGFYSLLFLVQAASRHGLTEDVSIDVVSSGMQQVAGSAVSCPEKATVLGPVRVVPQEYPGIRCRSIDLVLPQSPRWRDEDCLDLLMDELLAPGAPSVTALRAGEVWEQALVPRRISLPSSTPVRLRQGGTYLITGGLGSMGLAFAGYLAREVRANLVLVGRTDLPGADPDDRPNAASHFDPIAEAALVDRLDHTSAQDIAVMPIDGTRLSDLLHAFCSGLIVRYFRRQGVALAKGEVLSRQALRERLKVRPPFERFVSFMLAALAQDGAIAARGDEIEVLDELSPDVLERARGDLLAAHPDFRGLVRLLDHCAGLYGPALSGEVASISVLYPDGSPDFLDACYDTTPTYTCDAVHLQTAARLLAEIAARPRSGRLRILEVGGGTGGLTRTAVAALKDLAVDYHFTDLSPAFVRRAEADAAAHGVDFMRFGVLDIARSPEVQGYPLQGFDVVLGYNVVHATKDIAESLAQVRRLLAPGGVLMLVETTRLRRWDEMVWGLTEGWWHFTDVETRSASPLISLDAWERLMRRQGFEQVATYPRAAAARAASDVGLIIARAADVAASQSPTIAGGHDARAHTIDAAVREMRSHGGEVLVLRADVSEEDGMRAAVAEAQQRFGALHGIIHTAGVLGQGLIHDKSPQDVRAVFRPKVAGTLVIDTLLRERGLEPDFLILCASAASVAPIAGQIDYCAANAFLDAYAASRIGHGRTAVISVDWGFWQELGMIAQARAPQAWKQQITDEIRAKGRSGAGVQALRCILDQGPAPQVLVLPDGPDWPVAASTAAAVPPVPLVQSAEPAKLRHPWFEACLVGAATTRMYVSRLSVADWVLDEHRPMGTAVLPGTAYLELARAAFAEHAPGQPVQLTDVYFLAPLVLEDDENKEVRTILTQRERVFDFVIVSREGPHADAWHEHARGTVAALTLKPPLRRDLGDVERHCGGQDISVAAGGAGDRRGLAQLFGNFTPRWRSVERLQIGADAGLATLQLAPQFADEISRLPLHPALADVATGFMSVVDGFESGVPFHYECVRLWRPLTPRLYSHVRRVARDQGDERAYEATLLDPQGDVLLDVTGFTLRTYRDRSAERTDATRPDAERNFCVEIETPGSLATLAMRPDTRRSPGPGEVEIEVAAAGLNFIEVLYALGMLPEPDGGSVRFGLECAGTITAVGKGVRKFRAGDEVFGFAQGAFGRFVLTEATSIAVKPAALSFTQAATIPAAFTTAYYALITRGNLGRCERVLIHAASGGVGLAAVNIATWRGAEIFATAGTSEKRQYLRERDIHQVFDSRKLDFAAEVMEASQGNGVNVVLNSLGGDFISASLSVLARYGRFLELGKRDIFRNSALALAPFAKHLSFTAIDVGTDLPEFKQVWRQVVEGVRRGAFKPLPVQEFPLARLAEAFEFMAQGRHIGKIVLTFADADAVALKQGRRGGRPLEDILGRGAATAPTAALSDATADGRIPEAARRARAAPSHARPALSTPYRDPAGETERKVVAIWEELLGVSGIGADDNFLDLRGDSLLAAQVTSRLYAAFSVKLPLSSVFEHPTAAGLAKRIEQLRQSIRELETAPARALGEREVEHEL